MRNMVNQLLEVNPSIFDEKTYRIHYGDNNITCPANIAYTAEEIARIGITPVDLITFGASVAPSKKQATKTLVKGPGIPMPDSLDIDAFLNAVFRPERESFDCINVHQLEMCGIQIFALNNQSVLNGEEMDCPTLAIVTYLSGGETPLELDVFFTDYARTMFNNIQYLCRVRFILGISELVDEKKVETFLDGVHLLRRQQFLEVIFTTDDQMQIEAVNSLLNYGALTCELVVFFPRGLYQYC